MKRVLITGANRGLGFEFALQYLKKGAYVFAGCRFPDQAVRLKELTRVFGSRLTILCLDVTDDDAISRAAESVHREVNGLDILINNAAVYPKDELSVQQIDIGTMLQTFHVNTAAPMMMVKTFHKLLAMGDCSKVINMSSESGSLQYIRERLNISYYSYKSSKAALNAQTIILSSELKADGIVVIAVNPGWAKTDMGGEGGLFEPSEAVEGLINVIEGLNPDDTGKFYSWDGNECPW